MTSEDWKNETKKYSALNVVDRQMWLTSLIYTISFFGRSTYLDGADGLADPENLRRINEFIHRVASYQISLVRSKETAMSDSDFFSLLDAKFQSINISEATLLKFFKLPNVIGP